MDGTQIILTIMTVILTVQMSYIIKLAREVSSLKAIVNILKELVMERCSKCPVSKSRNG